ncbi:MAG: hypothetical protein HY747_05265 [Elusimicrobia bacterium]|nr:hypothetical protein [Elusimicrobiota bacterium]
MRTDSFIAPYLTIGTSYDSLIAKIIATSSNGRNGAIRRLQRALEETVIGGIATTIPFHRRLLAEPAFSEGKEWFSARFIETWTQKQKFN